MKKILLSNHYEGRPLEIINSVVPEGFCLEVLPEASQAELEERAADADYILASGRLEIGGAVLGRAAKLKMIQRTGVGLDSLDLEQIKRHNIPLYVNQGVNAGSVAEHTILLMLACLRRLPQIGQNTKNGIWKKQAQGVMTRELSGQVVGLIGMGHIGTQTAGLLKAFGAETLYYSRHRKTFEEEEQYGIRYVDLDALFAQSDIVSLHCSMNEQTENIICSETLDKMKDGVILINTARGKLIREEDLLAALRSGKIRSAGLDVFAEEPVKNQSLLEQENVIATPHIAGITYDSFSRMMQEAMRNIAAFDCGNLEKIEEYKLVF